MNGNTQLQSAHNKFQVHQHWDALKICVVGRSQQFSLTHGQWDCAMTRVLMRLPHSQRQTELAGLARQAHEMEAQQIVRNLSRE